MDIRRHFHTFKGNGRAVGANTLGELGWAVQDMLDRVIDGELAPDDKLQSLLGDVVEALPGLIASFGKIEGFNLEATRDLTNKCCRLANSGDNDMAESLAEVDDTARSPDTLREDSTIPQTIGQ